MAGGYYSLSMFIPTLHTMAIHHVFRKTLGLSLRIWLQLASAAGLQRLRISFLEFTSSAKTRGEIWKKPGKSWSRQEPQMCRSLCEGEGRQRRCRRLRSSGFGQWENHHFLKITQAFFVGSLKGFRTRNLLLTLSGWCWLEPWNFMTFHWEFHHPDWLIFFRGVGQPPTRLSLTI